MTIFVFVMLMLVTVIIKSTIKIYLQKRHAFPGKFLIAIEYDL